MLFVVVIVAALCLLVFPFLRHGHLYEVFIAALILWLVGSWWMRLILRLVFVVWMARKGP